MDYSELDQVLVFIRNKIQIYYDGSRRDSISDQIYPNSSQAPPPTTPGGRSSSFSQTTNNFSPPAAGVGPNGEFQYASKSVTEYNIANDKAQPVLVYSSSPTKKKINTVTFEKADLTTSTFSFSKEKISTNTVQSSLTKLVKPNEEKTKDMWSSYGDFTPPPNEGITITVHIGVHNIKGLKVRVIKQATVGQCVAATLKTYMYPSAPNISVKAVAASPSSPTHPSSAPPTPNPEKQISLDPKHYLFRIADESGNVDDDYPALDERQLVFKFKDENFILVPKIIPSAPAPSPVKPAETMKKSQPVQTSSRGNSMINLDTGVALDANGAPLTHRRTSSASMDPPLLLKVRLPDNTSTKVIMQGNMKVGDLLRHVCRKRQLNLDAHTLVLPRSLDPLELDTILNKLSSDEFMLCPSFLHSPSTASPKQRSHTGPSTPRGAAPPINPILPAPTLSNAPVTPRPTSPTKNNSSNIVYALTSLRTSLSKTNAVSAKVAATVAGNGTPNTNRPISMRSSSSLTLNTTNSSATILGTSASSVSLVRPQNREDEDNNTLVPPTSPLIAVSQDSQAENEVQENSDTANTENTTTENRDSPTKSPQKTSESVAPEKTRSFSDSQKENVDETNISVKVVSKPTPITETNGVSRESRNTPYGNIHSYTVYRLRKKQTIKKERVLSFNSEKIYNEKVSSKKESFNDSEDSKTRNIKDIAKVALSEKPAQFFVVMDDSKAYFYEAKEHSIAEEIVQKLNELITPSSP